MILAFGGYGDSRSGYNLGGLQVAFQAMEALRRGLASELGPNGIRVVTLQTSGVPESVPESLDWREAITEETERRTMLERAAALDAVFPASDHAPTMTSTTLNITCGTTVN